MLEINTVGHVSAALHGTPITLPASRKTRALLAYLALSNGARPRRLLCDLLWDTPNDPLAALRWSLSKLRSLVNSDGITRLSSDHTSVWLEPDDISTDYDRLAKLASDPQADEREAERQWQLAQGALLEDCELPNQPEFMAWLETQRTELVRMRVEIARRFAEDPAQNLPARDRWAARWLADAPFDGAAAYCAIQAKHAVGRRAEAEELAGRLAKDFHAAGLEVPAAIAEKSATGAADARSLPAQAIRFVETQDGVSIAWARVGQEDSPPLVKAANWLSHLELDWEAPIWSPLFRELTNSFEFIRYDERGCGLSDWDVADISLESFVTDLEQVADAAGLDRFPLLGISQGAAVSIEYAARHPDRVSHLILFGGYDCGWRHTASADEVREREAVMVLTETGWGRDNPAYRHMFSRTFMPDASADELEWFDEFQRQTTSPANAVRFLDAFSRIDVRARLADVQCPTLVVYSRGDLRIPFTTGRSLAANIPGAQLAGIDSNNHLLLGREAASAEFIELVQNFLSGPAKT